LTPLAVTGAVLALWAISWGIASIWSRRTAARPSTAEQALHLVPTVIGAMLLAWAMRARIDDLAPSVAESPLWRLPGPAGWLLVGLCVAGVGFAWWARLTLGDLWSGSVSRKEGHAIVVAGPYRFVRHPIYTGIILAFTAFALQLAAPMALAGVALLSLGFWLKARLEERFLAAELGESAYADYRRRTPMLVPFWPTARRAG
jgi:protein-S-isoprenylcysteine O-methyltransferase Ste14